MTFSIPYTYTAWANSQEGVSFLISPLLSIWQLYLWDKRRMQHNDVFDNIKGLTFLAENF